MDPSEAATPPPLEGRVSLTHWGLIRASGIDAAKFLHGQLTSDFSLLAIGDVRLAGFCSAKGRLQASFYGWKLTHDELLLACHASVLPATLKRLSMFVLRAQCRLSDASSELACTGLVGDAARRALSEADLAGAADWQQRGFAGGSVLRLPAVDGLARAVWVAPRDSAPVPPAPGPGADLSLDDWRWLEVHSGVPMIEAATVEQFVPQMLNYELVGGVDFQKGCYPGQEVVARSQYRGTVKRRMFLFDTDAACAPGQEVFHSADATQPAGMVVNAAPRPLHSGESALLEVKLAALDTGTLHLGSVDGPLFRRLPLPYPVPVDAAAEA